MQPKLKEDPKEWLKFTAVMALLAGVLAYVVYRPLIVIPVCALIVCALRPRWFRGFYRAGMTVSFHVGQVMGRILLTILFVIVVTPMGLLLRIFGKDLLQLKRRQTASYWRSAKNANQFDRMF